MSCLAHWQQNFNAKPLVMTAPLPNLDTGRSVISKEQDLPMAMLYAAYHLPDYSWDAASAVCHFFNSDRQGVTKIALHWLTNMGKAAKNPKKVATRVYQATVRNFWRVFENDPVNILANLNRDKNTLRRLLIQQIFQKNIPRCQAALQKWVTDSTTQQLRNDVWFNEDAFEGFLQLSSDLRMTDFFEVALDNLKAITGSRKIPPNLQAPLQRYFYVATDEETPIAQAKRETCIELLNRNLLQYLSKKKEWKNFNELDYPTLTYLKTQVVWSPFRRQLLQNLIKQKPLFLSHLNFLTGQSDYNQKMVLFAIAQAAPTYFEEQGSPQQKEIVKNLATESAERHLDNLETRARS